jgi:hypothetical protein
MVSLISKASKALCASNMRFHNFAMSLSRLVGLIGLAIALLLLPKRRWPEIGNGGATQGELYRHPVLRMISDQLFLFLDS